MKKHPHKILFCIILLVIALIAFLLAKKPAHAPGDSSIPPSATSLIEWEESCETEPRVLPLAATCPIGAQIADLSSFSSNEKIESPEVGYANIRSNGDINETANNI